MARRRQNGEGCWGKKTIHGTLYYFFRDSEGHDTYGRSKAQVEEKLKLAKEKKEKIEHEVEVDDMLTVGEYIKTWLYKKKYKEVGMTLDISTFDCYENAIKVRFYNYPIARVQLSALNQDAIVNYLKELSEKYSRGSIKKTWQVLKLGFTDYKFELYNRVPKIDFKIIKVPMERHCAVKTKKIQFTSNEDMEKLYAEALKKKATGAYYYGNAAKLLAFIMYSGLREAEACGLQWKDVDMDNHLITITQTYNQVSQRDEFGNRIGSKYIVKDPKSESSAATIPYRQKAAEILSIMNNMYPRHKPTDFVFLTDTGTPFQKRHVLHTLKRILKNTGLTDKEYTVHELRHGYGSILYQEGVDLFSISKLLRHADIQTTANIYLETTPDTLKNALASVDKK